MLKEYTYRWLLPKLLLKKSEQRIPRSGKEGEKVNCFSVVLDSQGFPFFLVRDFKDDKLEGLKWNGDHYEDKLSINLSDVSKYDFRVTHFYGLDNIYYESIYTIAWNYLTRLIYIKIKLYRKLSTINQYFFNKKKLITKTRMNLLLFMFDLYLDSGQDSTDVIDLMTKLYSIRWVNHPSKDDQMMKLKIYLESLVESGDEKREDLNYRITGKAITTLENFEKEEQRHNDGVRLQLLVVLLTLILVIIGIIQVGLIKLPVILNLSK